LDAREKGPASAHQKEPTLERRLDGVPLAEPVGVTGSGR
jgi:hypothetical protein